MAPLFTYADYDIEPTPRGLTLLKSGNHACDIAGSFAARLRTLLERLQSPAEMEAFREDVNCHGLTEHLLGRKLRWRNAPKYLGETRVAPAAPLPSPLPEGYQLMNWDGVAVHSGVLLGGSAGFSPYTLEKCGFGELAIARYQDVVADWVKRVCPLSCVRLRHPALPMRKVA